MSVRTNFDLVNKRSEMYSERPLPNLSHNKGQLGVPPSLGVRGLTHSLASGVNITSGDFVRYGVFLSDVGYFPLVTNLIQKRFYNVFYHSDMPIKNYVENHRMSDITRDKPYVIIRCMHIMNYISIKLNLIYHTWPHFTFASSRGI